MLLLAEGDMAVGVPTPPPPPPPGDSDDGDGTVVGVDDDDGDSENGKPCGPAIFILIPNSRPSLNSCGSSFAGTRLMICLYG